MTHGEINELTEKVIGFMFHGAYTLGCVWQPISQSCWSDLSRKKRSIICRSRLNSSLQTTKSGSVTIEQTITLDSRTATAKLHAMPIG